MSANVRTGTSCRDAAASPCSGPTASKLTEQPALFEGEWTIMVVHPALRRVTWKEPDGHLGRERDWDRFVARERIDSGVAILSFKALVVNDHHPGNALLVRLGLLDRRRMFEPCASEIASERTIVCREAERRYLDLRIFGKRSPLRPASYPFWLFRITSPANCILKVAGDSPYRLPGSLSKHSLVRMVYETTAAIDKRREVKFGHSESCCPLSLLPRPPPPPQDEDAWACRGCGAQNRGGRSTCFGCGKEPVMVLIVKT